LEARQRGPSRRGHNSGQQCRPSDTAAYKFYAVRPQSSAFRVNANLAAVHARLDTVAVEFDFMDPLWTVWRPVGEQRKAGLEESWQRASQDARRHFARPAPVDAEAPRAHRHFVPVRLGGSACSFQFGRSSAPMIPNRVHTIRGPNVGTDTSFGQG
jgi:hypothetical protein